MKIAECAAHHRKASPIYELSREYIPPVVRCDASTVLMARVKTLQDQLSAAARKFGQRRRSTYGTATWRSC